MKILSVLSIITYIGVTTAQISSFGKCPQVHVAQNFEPQRYLGVWFEQTKYPFIFQLYGKCTTATYGQKADGNVSVLNRQVNTITNKETTISGTARIISTAKLGVTFESQPVPREAPYWVLGTDYDNFAVVYSCNDIAGYLHLTNVWILTRQRHPSSEVIAQAFAVLDQQHIKRQFLMQTDQNECT